MTSDKKMVFFDIDGTIWTEPGQLMPDSAVRAIQELRSNGHLAFINSGRTSTFIPDRIRDLGFDGYVCGCGTYIYYQGEQLFSSTVSPQICRHIVQLMRDCRIPGFFEENDHMYFDLESPCSTDQITEIFGKVHGIDFNTLSEEEKAVFHFDKFLIMQMPDSDMDTFRQYIDDKFDYIDRGHNIGEIVQKGYSKASGIQFLMDHLDIPLKNCYAIGDSANDLPMLQFVPNSIAMGNSSSEILPYCAYQTDSVMEDGLYHALKHYNLI